MMGLPDAAMVSKMAKAENVPPNMLMEWGASKGIPAALINLMVKYDALQAASQRQQAMGQGQPPQTTVAQDVDQGIAALQNPQPQPQLPPQGMPQDQNPAQTGVAALDAGQMENAQYAGGGIVAFAGGGAPWEVAEAEEAAFTAENVQKATEAAKKGSSKAKEFLQRYKEYVTGEGKGVLGTAESAAKGTGKYVGPLVRGARKVIPYVGAAEAAKDIYDVATDEDMTTGEKWTSGIRSAIKPAVQTTAGVLSAAIPAALAPESGGVTGLAVPAAYTAGYTGSGAAYDWLFGSQDEDAKKKAQQTAAAAPAPADIPTGGEDETAATFRQMGISDRNALSGYGAGPGVDYSTMDETEAGYKKAAADSKKKLEARLEELRGRTAYQAAIDPSIEDERQRLLSEKAAAESDYKKDQWDSLISAGIAMMKDAAIPRQEGQYSPMGNLALGMEVGLKKTQELDAAYKKNMSDLEKQVNQLSHAKWLAEETQKKSDFDFAQNLEDKVYTTQREADNTHVELLKNLATLGSQRAQIGATTASTAATREQTGALREQQMFQTMQQSIQSQVNKEVLAMRKEADPNDPMKPRYTDAQLNQYANTRMQELWNSYNQARAAQMPMTTRRAK
jgi:hypothetical protein